ncbi:hypothetical protein L4C34_17430 [Vibrio profundum]|uniref:hypothetical protein n=1 Tax=Vibrio profundum TaxID=2910247 RepID=UPI003D0AC4F9
MGWHQEKLHSMVMPLCKFKLELDMKTMDSSLQAFEEGRFEIDTSLAHEHILCVKFLGQWEIQIAENFADSLHQQAMQTVAKTPWGVVNDLRDWGLCTPEVMSYFIEKLQTFADINLRWHAVIPNNQVHNLLIDKVYHGGSHMMMANQYFGDMESALDWLRGEIT